MNVSENRYCKSGPIYFRYFACRLWTWYYFESPCKAIALLDSTDSKEWVG